MAHPPAPSNDITGVILAGGRGTRMGGVDKGLQPLAGRPLVAHVLERLAPQVDRVLINVNRSQADYARLGYPLIEDRIGGFAGPLAGLHTALAHAGTALVATVPCDSPFLPADLVDRLRAGLQASGAPLAIAAADDRLHPVFALCRRDRLPALDAYLQQGGRKVAAWCDAQGACIVPFDDCPAAFRNFNTLDDLQPG